MSLYNKLAYIIRNSDNFFPLNTYVADQLFNGWETVLLNL